MSAIQNDSRIRQILDEIRELNLSGNVDQRNTLIGCEAESIRRYLHCFRLDGFPEELMQAYVNDALSRFLHTLELLPCTSGIRVLELGANPYLFSSLVRRFFDYRTELSNFFDHNIYEREIGRGAQVLVNDTFSEEHVFEYSIMNLELSDYPFPDSSFDLILFCEILEHLVIDPLEVFPRLFRLLAPGGRLVLTTPNAVRLVNFANMLAGSNFFDRYHPATGVYGRHNREFTVEELDRLLSRAGYVDIETTTFDRQDYDKIAIHKDNYEAPLRLPYTKKQLLNLLLKSGGTPKHRGDNIYIVAYRPSIDSFDVASGIGGASENCRAASAPSPSVPSPIPSSERRILEERIELLESRWKTLEQSLSWRILQFVRGLVGRKW